MNEQPIPPQNLSQVPVPPAMPESDRDVAANKDMAALSYVWVLSVFVYAFRRDSSFVRFHALQAMMLFALSVVCWFIPFIGKPLELIVLLLSVAGFASAAMGQRRELPLIYALSHGDIAALRSSWRDAVDTVMGLWRNVRHRASKDTPTQAESAAEPSPPTSL